MKDEELIVVGGSFLGMVLASVVVLLWLRADVEQQEVPLPVRAPAMVEAEPTQRVSPLEYTKDFGTPVQEESTSYYVYPRPFRDRSQRAEVERQVKAWAERNPEDWARMHGR